MVEFAVVLPVLLMIILGIIYFGRYEDYSDQMTQMADEGARYAAVNFDPPGTPTLQQYIASQAIGELAVGSSDVITPVRVYVYQPSSETSNWKPTYAVRVCVLATVTFPTLIGSPTTTIAQTATMRIETAPNATDPYTVSNPGTLAPYTAGTPDATIPKNCSQS